MKKSLITFGALLLYLWYRFSMVFIVTKKIKTIEEWYSGQPDLSEYAPVKQTWIRQNAEPLKQSSNIEFIAMLTILISVVLYACFGFWVTLLIFVAILFLNISVWAGYQIYCLLKGEKEK